MKKMQKNKLLIVCSIIVLVGTLVVAWIYSSNASLKKDILDSIDSAWNEANTEDDPAFLQEISKLSSYKIISIDKGTIHTINVVVKGIDLSNKLRELSYEDFPQAADEEAINAYLLDMIKDCITTETSTVIFAEQTDDGYQISFSDTFVDAMSGKIYSFYMEQIESLLEE